MGKNAQILAILADGQFHSGQELAEKFALSRSGIWKAIQSLQALGVDVFAVQGKGYRLAQPLELLHHDNIKEHLRQTPAIMAMSRNVEVLWSVNSTNMYLSDLANHGYPSGSSVVAELQTQGRGRRGRQWISPLGGNIYLSQLWQFLTGPAQLSGLSLAAAIAVVRVVKQFGINNAGLKWPNDILVNGHKLAGILLEMRGESSGPTSVVVGVGINVRVSDEAAKAIDQPHTSMEKLLGKTVPRNKLVANLIHELHIIYDDFLKKGFSGFVEEWCLMDVYQDKPVNLLLASEVISGIGRGVDQNGALKLEQQGEISSFQSGEISLRG